MRRSSIALLILTIAALAGAASGCGSDSSTTEATLTKQQFLKQANQICAKALPEQTAALEAANRKALKVEREDKDVSPQEGAEIISGPVLSVIGRMIEEVQELGLPQGDEETAEEVLAEYEKGLETAEDDPTQFFSGEAFRAADEAGTNYGLKECGA